MNRCKECGTGISVIPVVVVHLKCSTTLGPTYCGCDTKRLWDEHTTECAVAA